MIAVRYLVAGAALATACAAGLLALLFWATQVAERDHLDGWGAYR